jgi:16S rRNA (cytosine967-C5)-methyltransferase
MREDNQVRQVLKIIEAYDFSLPLGRFLSEHYKANKQMGSRDRRHASQLIFSYFRIGKACPEKSMEERLAIGFCLCATENSELYTYFMKKFGLPAFSKIQNLHPCLNLEAIFPFSAHLSKGIDPIAFTASFFNQPKLFIRMRRKFRTEILKELKKSRIEFTEVLGMPETLAFANTTSLTNLESFRKGYFEIQDKSSQQTGDYYKASDNEFWWDCCAASGGKSLLLADHVPRIKLMVSDIRESILQNLKERFAKVQFRNYTTRQLDLNIPLALEEGPFDGILLDAPCTGSGTWARSPEMISGFDENEILKFQALQKNIAVNVLPFLKPGKPLVYSTCSVFKEENESVIDFLVKQHAVKVEDMKVISGVEAGADSMFVARLIKV